MSCERNLSYAHDADDNLKEIERTPEFLTIQDISNRAQIAPLYPAIGFF